MKNYFTQPRYMLIGIIANTRGTMIEKAVPVATIMRRYFGLLTPKVRKALWKPCNKCQAQEIQPSMYTITTHPLLKTSSIF